MKLLGSTENRITKDKNGENVVHLDIPKVILVHGNIVDNDYQQDSRVFYTFFPNKSFGQLLELSPTNSVFLKTFNLKCSYIKVWSTDQNSHPPKIKDRINLTLVIKKYNYFNALFN